MRVLLIEDDATTAQLVELMLKSERMNVFATDSGEEGVDLAKFYDYDIILLDLGLPDISGLDVLRRLRAAKVRTPVMVVSGRTDIETKLSCFSAGSDDYLGKPFHKDELVARIHALVRRSVGLATAHVDVGDLRVHMERREAVAFGKHIHLTGKEFSILQLLAIRRGAMVPKEAVLNHVYGGMDEPESKIVDVYICKLRDKLQKAGLSRELIVTVWGQGYALRAPDMVPAASPATAPAQPENKP